jgi:Flp pilus assembly pilin Flp
MRILKLLQDARGTSAVEYAFVAVFIAVGCMAGYAALGAQTNTTWQSVSTKSKEAIGY